MQNLYYTLISHYSVTDITGGSFRLPYPTHGSHLHNNSKFFNVYIQIDRKSKAAFLKSYVSFGKNVRFSIDLSISPSYLNPYIKILNLSHFHILPRSIITHDFRLLELIWKRANNRKVAVSYGGVKKSTEFLWSSYKACGISIITSVQEF